MRNILLIVFIAILSDIGAQTVSTYAGVQYIGTGRYNDDPEQAFRKSHIDSVVFSAPTGIAVDTAGRIYVSNEHNIMWISGTSTYVAVGSNYGPNDAGSADSKNSGGILARFNSPAGLALNPLTNNLIVADMLNSQIRNVEPFKSLNQQQQVSTITGTKGTLTHKNGATSIAEFNYLTDVAIASNGDIFVADRSNHVIRKISGGQVSTIAGSAGNTGKANGTGSSARFSAPWGLFLDGNTLYVADYGNSAIREIDITNNSVTDFITTGLSQPKDLIKHNGAFYIVQSLCIKKFENNVLNTYAGNPNVSGYVNANGTSARFESLTSIVYHAKNNLFYVVDQGNNVVRSLSTESKPVCNFTASTTSATKGQTIILKSTTTSKPINFKWTITPNTSYTLLNSSIITDSLIYISFNQTGVYSVKLWASNAFGADSLLKSNYLTITSLDAPPVANFNANKITAKLNEVVNLIDLSSNGPTTWKWRISPATFDWVSGTDSTKQFPKIKFSALGKYTITLIAKNIEGQHQETKVDYINIANSSNISTSNTLDLSIFPNPCSEILNIKNTNAGFHLQIFNLAGAVIFNQTIDENQAVLNTADFKPGLYFIKVSNSENSTIRRISIIH